MGDTGQIHVRVDSTDDLMAVAEALEHEAAARYRALSARMARQGDNELATQFEVLAGMEDRHASQIGDRCETLFGHRPDLARVKWETPPGFDEDEARGAEISAYRALAFAVRNEERAFAFYSYLSAEAKHDGIRALAEELAHDELQHAALLRQYRRRAFHDKRPAPADTPETVDELLSLARRWDAEAAMAHSALAQGLDAIGEKADASVFRQLADEETLSAANTPAANIPALRSAADGLRLLEQCFDRYALIAEKADDEKLVAEAQRLADRMVKRMALTGGLRSNAPLSRPIGRD
jgi:rubrerythrin